MAGITILLLRGVNVGGANRMPMAGLRDTCADLGLTDTRTYIQSGNAVFTDPGLPDLPDRLAAAMLDRFGFAPAMILHPLTSYESILAANPFVAQGKADGAKVHILFLAKPAPQADLAALRALASEGETLHLTDLALYLFAPNGVGRSTLAQKLPRFVPVEHTARNQRSAEAICALAHSLRKS